MNQIYYLVRMFIVDKILMFIVGKIKKNFSKNHYQALVFLFLLLIYFHGYFYAIVNPKPDFYKILNVNHRIKQSELRSIGRKILAKLHPDKHPELQEDYMKTEEVLSVLGNKSERWLYDRFKPKLAELKRGE